MIAKITSYNEASDFIGDADHRKIGNNTSVERRAYNEIAIRLHGTDIVTFRGTYGPFPDQYVILNANGWCSATTVRRMHAFTPNTIRVNKRSNNDGDPCILVTAENEAGPMLWDGISPLLVRV